MERSPDASLQSVMYHRECSIVLAILELANDPKSSLTFQSTTRRKSAEKERLEQNACQL